MGKEREVNGGFRRTVAIYGGSFDPFHCGHGMVAAHVAQCGAVDEVWIMVSPQNPLKKDSSMMPDAQRLEMARLAMKDCPGVRVSDFEFSLPVPSYTYHTLLALRKQWPDTRFVVLVGEDNWDLLSKWRDYDRIIEEFGVIVYPRPGASRCETTLPANVVMLEDAPQMLVSSTHIRNMIQEGKSVRCLVPESVERYISEKELYR